MPREGVCHIYDPERFGYETLCQTEPQLSGWRCTLEAYMTEHVPITGEWCMACEEVVYENSPHPELIELARTPLE